MIIDCISDLHGHYPDLEGGDLLIVAGDLTARDLPGEYAMFHHWLWDQNYRIKIFIAGNHDGGLAQYRKSAGMTSCEEIYLEDSAVEIDGLKIWGTPWTPPFCDWYFMAKTEKRKEIFEAIPNDIDILVSHGPPWGLLDTCYDWDEGKIINVGCHHLRIALERIRPKLHVYGHIHEGYGQILFKHQGPNTICVNASHMDKNYKPVNKPIRIIL